MSEQNEQGTTAAGGDALVEQDHAAKAAEATPLVTSATPAATGAVPVAVEKYRPAVVADADKAIAKAEAAYDEWGPLELIHTGVP